MKKSMLNVITLALVLINLVLTVLLTFSLVSTNNRTNNLIKKVGEIIDLDAAGNAANGSQTGSAVNIDDIEYVEVKSGDSTNITVSYTDSGKTHYVVFKVTLGLNKKHPIEINKDYCLQIEIDDRKGISYHESLKQILRHDPDVIMVGEVRDEKTAQLALTCALTGHLVLTTIHASNCINTIKRLENLNISSLDLEDVLLGIMTQKMRFNDKKEVFILSEYIDQKNLLKYFDRKKIDYYDFSKAACTLKNVGVLNEK